MQPSNANTSMAVISFEIPQLPKLPNQIMYSHWRTRHNHATKWKNLVIEATVKLCLWKNAELSDRLPFKKARVIITRCSSRQPDFDNLVSSIKPLLDGLVKAGIISDDRQDVIAQPIVLWEKAGRRAGKIKIKVEEL